jgi:hypothetical protein
MEIIDKEKTMKWLSSKGLLDSKGSLSFSGFSKPVSYRIPTASGKKTVLSRVITSLFDSETESLLWIDEWGIWPSCEDWTLFEGFRKSLGESTKLYEKPGHIFSKQDLGAITSLVAMVLYFCCGAVIVPTTKSFIIKISHDEFIDIYSQDKEVLIQIKSIIKKGVDLDTL